MVWISIDLFNELARYNPQTSHIFAYHAFCPVGDICVDIRHHSPWPAMAYKHKPRQVAPPFNPFGHPDHGNQCGTKSKTWKALILKKHLDADLHRFALIIQRLKQKQRFTFWVTTIFYVSICFICVYPLRLEAPTFGYLRPIAGFRFKNPVIIK